MRLPLGLAKQFWLRIAPVELSLLSRSTLSLGSRTASISIQFYDDRQRFIDVHKYQVRERG